MSNHYKPLSRFFPAYHPKAGQPTHFVERVHQCIWDLNDLPYYSLHEMLQKFNPGKDIDEFIATIDTETIYAHKSHTIRAGNKVKPGDTVQFYVWTGKPYRSKQIKVTPKIEVKKVWDFEINQSGAFLINGEVVAFGVNEDIVDIIGKVADNDGLEKSDMLEWLKYHPKKKHNAFVGQILCWNESINY